MKSIFNLVAKHLLSVAAFVFLYAGAWAQAKVTVGSEISASDSLVLEVRGVDDASVNATPVERTSPNGKQLYCAYDIDITKDGREWQPEPEQPAMVTMQDPNFADGQMLDIYHEGANGLEFVATVASENGKITFPAHSFSVYIVAQAENYNRLKVILHQADGNVVTIWVKKLDLDRDTNVFNRIVYNPGMGTPAAGVKCLGWIAKENYDAADVSSAMTYDAVRDSISTRLSRTSVTDGTELHFYTMLFKSYTVTYVADSAIINTHYMPFRVSDENPVMSYTVNTAYTPRSNTEKFAGWLVASSEYGQNIEDHPGDNHNYVNGTEIRIKGDVVFNVNVIGGHWLIYHENGKGATYKAADFVKSGENTEAPSIDMMRLGYTFVGWYDRGPVGWTETHDTVGEPRGNLFSFGRQLTANTHVFAKWNPKTTAGYSVIIWKQNVDGHGYDFDTVISLSGTVGQNINTVSSVGTGNGMYARINGRNYTGTEISGRNYTGFHLDRFDQNVKINTEGNAVLNVYYDRNRYTLHFQVEGNTWNYVESTSTSDGYYYIPNGSGGYTEVRLYRNDNRWWRTRRSVGSWWSSSYEYSDEYVGPIYERTKWYDIKTITALYEQDISTNFPIQGTNGVDYTGYVWEPQNSSIFASGDVPSLDAMREENTVFHAKKYGSGTTIHMYYYTEALGSTSIQYQGRYFDEHQHVKIFTNGGINSTEDEDFINILGYDKLTSDPRYGSDGTVSLNSGNRYTIKFYYTRKFYTVNYMDGAYYDGDGNPLDEIRQGQLDMSTDIAYGADVSSCGNYRPDAAHTPAGFVFEGWYSDQVCTQRYEFTKMPEGGITVYAKWRQIQYRVFLHPNITQTEAPHLSWGSSGQTTNFRIDYGGKISAPNGVCDDYDFIGWYTDEDFMNPFSEIAVTLNDGNTTTYNKGTDYTDPMDKWGQLGADPWNSDARGYNGGDRFWITRKYDLYGRWRAKLPGAKGIIVVYTGNNGTEFNDTASSLYQDNVDAIAKVAPTHSDANKEFSYWVLQRYDNGTGSYVDMDTILPNTPFKVRKSNAKVVVSEWCDPDNNTDISTTEDATHSMISKATYTVKLRAVYMDKEEESPEYTFIQWFRNDGTADIEHTDGNINTSISTLGINVAVAPPAAPTRAGYIFKGWYKSDNGTGAAISGCDPEFLYYDNATNKYYRESTYTNRADSVAADEYSPIEYLYAIWEPKVEFDIAPICKGDQIVLPTTTTNGVDLSRGSWSWTVPAGSGSISGSTYTASTDATSVTLTFRPDYSETCAHETGIPVSIQALDLSVSDDFDYIWKGGAASSERDWNTASNWYVYNRNNHTYSVATVLPEAAKNIYVGDYNCKANLDPMVGVAEAYAKDITIASGASLTIPEGKTLNIAGNLDIAADATFSADNTNSKVVFNGSSDQSINRPVTFRDVKFAQTGVHQITIPEMMTVTGKATFEKGIVNANATFNNDASAEFADGARYNSYVSGTVTKKGNAESFTFPLGDDGVLGAFTTKIANNTDDGVSIKFNHKRDGNGTGFSIEDNYPRWWNINDMCAGSNALPRFDHVSNYEYWKVVDMGDETSLSAITLKVDASNQLEHFNHTFNGRDNEKIYAAAHFDCWKNIGGPAEALQNSNQTITVSVSSISRSRGGNFDGIITLGSIDHNTVLPIELTSFSATCDGHSTLVEWTTATEKNNDYFSLERSDDAINFTEIARIAGAGNSIERLDYSYTDFGVHGGDNYYRLVQVDYDGTRTASEIIVANCSDMPTEEPEVVAYPNPFNSDLTVELENFGDRPARIDVYDVLGRLVYTEEVAASQNDYQTVLHLGGLSDATYTVRVATSDFVINRKVVKHQ